MIDKMATRTTALVAAFLLPAAFSSAFSSSETADPLQLPYTRTIETGELSLEVYGADLRVLRQSGEKSSLRIDWSRSLESPPEHGLTLSQDSNELRLRRDRKTDERIAIHITLGREEELAIEGRDLTIDLQDALTATKEAARDETPARPLNRFQLLSSKFSARNAVGVDVRAADTAIEFHASQGSAEIFLDGGSLMLIEHRGPLAITGKNAQIAVNATRGDFRLKAEECETELSALRGKIAITTSGGRLRTRKTSHGTVIRADSLAEVDAADIPQLDLHLKNRSQAVVKNVREIWVNLRNSTLDLETTEILTFRAQRSFITAHEIGGATGKAVASRLDLDIRAPPPRSEWETPWILAPEITLTRTSHAVIAIRSPCVIRLPEEDETDSEHLRPGACEIRREARDPGKGRAAWGRQSIEIIAKIEKGSTLEVSSRP